MRLAKDLGNLSAIQTETHELAVLDAQTGRIAEARVGYEEALRSAKELGDLGAIQTETHGLAALNFREGKLEAARDSYLRALELARQLRDPSKEAYELRNLANTLRFLGETHEAREYLQESLALSQRINDPYQIGTTYLFLGLLNMQERRRDDAIADYREALRYLEPIQSPDAEEARQALRALEATP